MRKIFAILLFCFHVCAAQAEVHYRAAGVDVATQKYFVQWCYPSVSDTFNKIIRVQKLIVDAQQNIIIDTLAEVLPSYTRYTDSTTSCCEPNIYTIQLVSKINISYNPYEKPFRTMQLKELSRDECSYVINLQWSAYQQLDQYYTAPIPAFDDSVCYHIYGYAGGDTFKPDSAAWLATSGKDTAFALPITQEKKRYHLYVAAVYNGNADTSYSNYQSVDVPLPTRPAYIKVDSVQSKANAVALRFRIDPNTEYTRFCAEKSNDINGSFTSFANFGKQQTSATDERSNGVAFYRISAVNSSGCTTLSSPVATSIAVNVASYEASNSISWNNIGYNGKEAHYNVYRTQPLMYAGLLGSAPRSPISDDLTLFPDSIIGNQFCYVVEGITDSLYVRSSEVCSRLTPQVYMPNAIQLSSSSQNSRTGKSRNLFEPISSFSLRYELYIHARNGRLIYNGSKPWNGQERNTGNFVNEGSYVYLIKITFANGDKVEKTGNVTVVY